ncbi:MAG TPA: alginate lyase family protein [Anaerolineales bacterium]|nr:alginate lyase family protein [Anaerolineales bacterium]
MMPLRRAWRAALELGPSSLTSYLIYRAGLAVGWFRWQTPAADWDSWPLARLLEPGVPSDPTAYAAFRAARSRPRFFLDPCLRRSRGSPGEARRVADGILKGVFPLGGGQSLRLRFPLRSWDVDVDGKPISAESIHRHWSEVDLRTLTADARFAWELSRFGWALPLVRAFQATGDRRYADGFWRLWTAWSAQNHPNRGLQWTSAQEVALRLLALTCALYGFGPAWKQRPERLADLARGIFVHARRIPPTVAYARAQGNNHVWSEAAGLYTAGLLFPEARGASRWRELGQSLLFEGVRRQILPDGGYVQHSANYHRLAIQLGLWVARLAELNGEPLPEDVTDALGWSTLALSALVDARTGVAARFGPDDGSNLLPLGGTPDDYRPTLEAASRQFLHRSLFGPGSWESVGEWLGLNSPPSDVQSRSSRDNLAAVPANLPFAGLYRLGGRETWGQLRAAHFIGRPGHSDQLHVDLWWRGTNVALDPGTYLYRAPVPWEGGLAEAALHNTLTLDGREPMERAGPFLWLRWAQARLIGRWTSAEGDIEVVAAEHDGYRPIIHRRTVVRAGESEWWIVDDVLGAGPHQVKVGWNVPDVAWSMKGPRVGLRPRPGRVTLSIEGGALGLYRAGGLVGGSAPPGASPAWGWRSPGYGRIEPCLRIVAGAEAELPMRMVSRWGFGGGRTAPAKVTLRPAGEGPCPVATAQLGRTILWIDGA